MNALERPALPADSPAAWLAQHLAARFVPEGEPVRDPVRDPVWVGLADLLADDAARLRRAHDAITANGTPGQAASHYLADWYAGAVAGVIGFALAAGGCGFLVVPDGIRWRVHHEGWPEAVELGRVDGALVLPGHPWADRQDVTVVATAEELIERSIDSVSAAVEGILDACRSFARVGRPGMWNEVGDGVGSLLCHQDLVEVTPAMVEVLEAAVRTPAAPWKAKATYRLVPSRGRSHFVMQKGGCCLAYTRGDWPDEPIEDLDPAQRAYREAFPNPAPGEPWYCSTCSFRDADDCAARVVLWHELTYPEP